MSSLHKKYHFSRTAVNFNSSLVNIIIHYPILSATSDNEIREDFSDEKVGVGILAGKRLSWAMRNY